MTHEQNKDLYAEDFFDSVDKLDKLTKKNQYIVTAVLMLLCAAAIIAFFTIVLTIRNVSEGAGARVGDTLGKTVGMAVGSFEGAVVAVPDGVEKGKTQGLSAEDTVVDLKGILTDDLGEHGKLEVLTAKIKLDTSHKVGEKYSVLYIIGADAVFSVDLNKITIQNNDGNMYIELPQPTYELNIDYSDIEVLDERSRKLRNGKDSEGIEAFINSERQIKEAAENEIGQTLYELASEEAERQVRELAQSVCVNSSVKSLSVKTREN